MVLFSRPAALPRFSLASPYLACQLALLCGLAGCAAVDVPPLPDAVPAAWRQAPAATDTAAALAPDLHSWWKALGDPALDALVDRALAQNLTLAQARSRLREARLLAGQGNAQFLPTLSANSRSVQDVSATDTYFQASLDAVWELGLFGARTAAERAGQAGIDTALANGMDARVSTVAEVARNYTELQAARTQDALLQRITALDARTLELTGLRDRQRLGSPDERNQATARLAQSRAQQSQPRQAAERAAQSLAVLLGQTTPDSAWTALPAAAPQAPFRAFALQQVPADLLRYRPDVRRAEAEVLKTAAALGSATAALYPRVTLGASFLYSYNLTQHRPRSTVDDVPAIGPFIDIPLLDWGRRRAAADAQKAALEASLQHYRQAVLDGVADTESALGALRQARENSARLREAQEALERSAQGRATLVRLRLGSQLEQIAAERAVLQLAIEQATAETSQTLAFIALYKSLGGAPLPADEASTPLVSATPAQERTR